MLEHLKMAAVQPSSNSELQLYRVLQRANLLQYFETFITQGGDDVQQLCEAGEDEFLEIMALVGMASKPLHVRRLQKALQEWVTNPAAFEVAKKFPTHVMSISCSPAQNLSPSHSLERPSNLQDYIVTPSQSSAISTSTPWGIQIRETSPSDGSNLDDPSTSNSPQGDIKDPMKDSLYSQTDSSYPSGISISQPVLLENQIVALATAAAMLAQELPPFEPKPMPKKQISKDIQKVMMMAHDEPNRLDAMRRYAAIYGRFDSKRKNHRPMSLHEISVNEAAAHLCNHIPALLTRREELFPLARQVVRDSGYHYSKDPPRFDEQGATEIPLQPKLEESEATLSATSFATPPTEQDDSFHDLQTELTQITLDLTELAKEQNRIRSALRVLLEMNDHDQMKALTAEMDDLNDRQTAMNRRRQKIISAITKYRKSGSNSSVLARVLNKQSSHDKKSGKIGRKVNSGLYGYAEEYLAANPLNTLYMAAIQNHQDSLFEEGLRIATQYGMSDFAQELIGMKSTKEEVENKNECSTGTSSVSTSPREVVTSSSLPSKSTSTVKSSYRKHSGKSLPTGRSASYISYTSNDESTDGSTLDDACSISKLSTTSDKQKSDSTTGNSVAQGSTTTTTTITTKSGQVIEVETRRSSRRKNRDPDYYLFNGGEKRFRSGGNIRRSNSTSSEHARKLSPSSSSSPSLPPSIPVTSPTTITLTSSPDTNQKSCIQTNDNGHSQADAINQDFNPDSEPGNIDQTTQGNCEQRSYQ